MLSAEAIHRRIDTEALLAAAIDRLPSALLTALARALAAPRPLGPWPGWCFGAGEHASDLRGRLRLRLWATALRRRVDRPVRLRWYDGLRVDLRLGNDLSRCLYVGGAYDPNEFAFLARLLQPGMVVVDAGANEGLYTLFAARRVGPGGRVLAVEPSPRELQWLRRNVRLNRLPNVAVVPRALADRAGAAQLQVAQAEHAGQNTLGGFIYRGVVGEGEATVELARLDDLLDEHELDHIDLIKLDVEGAEFAALRGAAATLRRCQPALLLELSDAALQQQKASAAALHEFLQAHDYRLFTFDPATGLPVAAQPAGDPGLNVIALSEAAASRLGLATAAG